MMVFFCAVAPAMNSVFSARKVVVGASANADVDNASASVPRKSFGFIVSLSIVQMNEAPYSVSASWMAHIYAAGERAAVRGSDRRTLPAGIQFVVPARLRARKPSAASPATSNDHVPGSGTAAT